jgi:hypothetical protein
MARLITFASHHHVLPFTPAMCPSPLVRKLRNITAGSDRTRKGSMRKQLRMWQGKLLSSATLLQQQSAVDQRLLARLASSSVDASFSRGAQGAADCGVLHILCLYMRTSSHSTPLS